MLQRHQDIFEEIKRVPVPPRGREEEFGLMPQDEIEGRQSMIARTNTVELSAKRNAETNVAIQDVLGAFRKRFREDLGQEPVPPVVQERLPPSFEPGDSHSMIDRLSSVEHRALWNARTLSNHREQLEEVMKIR